MTPPVVAILLTLAPHPLAGTLLDLECPCCGNDGAVADSNGEFYDEQPLICGCPGWVSVEEDGEASIHNGEEPCEAGHD